MRKTITILAALITIMMINLASALVIDINIQESFSKGEQVYFDYSISSDVDIDIEYTPYVLCEDAPQALLEKKTASLSAGVIYKNTYTDFTVSEDISPQTCTAGINIDEPVFSRKEKSFEIATNPQVDLTIKLNNKVFTKGENIEISYSSSLTGLDVQAELTYPDNRKEQITLPASLKATEIGTYELSVQASAEGYESVTRTEQFGVIEKEAEVQSISLCNGDGVCDSGENLRNCPQDCNEKILSPEEADKIERRNLSLIVLGVVAGILFILALVYFLLKKKSER